jgi:hypothetical protein
MSVNQSLLRPLAALAIAGLLAACAGAGSAPPTSPGGPMSVSPMQPLANLIDPAACKKDHGVSLKPCSLSLSGSKPTATVTAMGPTGSVFTFNDKACSMKGIATVSKDRKKYLADWGFKSGSCTVLFTDKVKGKTIGTATLSIKNTA